MSLSSLRSDELALKKSPFVFIKLLVIIEFAFGLGPFFLAAFIGARQVYEGTSLSRTLNYDLLSAFALTTILVFVLVAAFVAWYAPTYLVSPERVLLRRGGLFSDRKLVDTQQVASIRVHQGWLARRLNYGSLELEEWNGTRGVIHSVPSPDDIAEQIQALIDRTLELPVVAPPERSPVELITAGEGQFVEFKASLMWDYRQSRANKELYEPVMKNIVGYLNTRGGALLIGVDDDGNVLGLEPDYGIMKKGDKDGFENVFNMAFNSMIGLEFRRFVDVAFPIVDEQEICLIQVQAADHPAYLTNKGVEKFYIRAGNASQALTVSKAAQYILSRFE